MLPSGPLVPEMGAASIQTQARIQLLNKAVVSSLGKAHAIVIDGGQATLQRSQQEVQTSSCPMAGNVTGNGAGAMQCRVESLQCTLNVLCSVASWRRHFGILLCGVAPSAKTLQGVGFFFRSLLERFMC